MALGLLGLKVGMTQVYDDKGKLEPVTVLQVGPCPVLLVRDQEREADRDEHEDRGHERVGGQGEEHPRLAHAAQVREHDQQQARERQPQDFRLAADRFPERGLQVAQFVLQERRGDRAGRRCFTRG